MLSPLPVQSLLKDYGLYPKKGLGQNFLVDDTCLRRIVEAAEVGPTDEVLEIGAGLGSLTRYLALAAGQVCAVEMDRRLPGLKKVLKDFENVTWSTRTSWKWTPASSCDRPVTWWLPTFLITSLLPLSVIYLKRR
jgi:16S rRNA (adenine1518-N6/adenine1519-N6)-dimethyltransferase